MKVSAGKYSDLWKAIIRPPKHEYTQNQLGEQILLTLRSNYVQNRKTHFQEMWFGVEEPEEFNSSMLPFRTRNWGKSGSKASLCYLYAREQLFSHGML